MSKTYRECAALSCHNTNRNSDVCLFGFPKNQPRRLEQWQNNIPLKEKIRKERLLCSDHFELSAFTNTFKRRLLPGAVPRVEVQQAREQKGEVTSLNASTKSSAMPTMSPPAVKVVAEASSAKIIPLPDSECPEESPEVRTTPSRSASSSKWKNATPKTRKINKYRCAMYRMKRRLFLKKLTCKYDDRQMNLKKMRSFLKPALYNLLASQIKNSNLPAKGRRWSSNEKAFAFNIYLTSPAAYRILRCFLVLPTVRTLRRSIQGVCQDKGFSSAILEVLRIKVQKMKPKCQCVVSLDEMKIRPALVYDSRKDSIVGYEDKLSVQSDREHRVATHALVFMARGVQENWKQVLGYFLAHHGMPGSALKELVHECIGNLQEIGLIVTALVCDQGSNNLALFSNLGLSEERTSFLVNGEKVYFLFDPPHLLKALRNNMMQYCVMFNSDSQDAVAKWKYISDYYNLDSKQHFRSAPKLTSKHINPLRQNKMKVKLASQVLSNTVAAGICLLTSVGAFVGEASNTAKFVYNIDSLFDSFNSQSLYAKKKTTLCCHEGFFPHQLLERNACFC